MGKHTTLYDEDFLSWTDVQVAELRKLASLPELSNAMDWENLIEEVETLGRSEISSVRNKIEVALEHILKAYCDPDSLSVMQWRKETDGFLDQARDDYRKSMHQRLDVEALWKRAGRSAFRQLEGYVQFIPPGIVSTCPFSLEQLIDERFTFEHALRHMHATKGGNKPFEFSAGRREQ
jgi:Domain of unknown function DUF29